MIALAILTAVLFLASLIKSRQKTLRALKCAGKKALKFVLPLSSVIILVALALTFLPRETLSRLLSSENLMEGTAAAAFFGSITMMPGFIAFPLGGLLHENGVPFMIIAAFTSTLMMVGLLTFPIEKEAFGFKTALTRNLVSLLIALIVALVTGLVFGELVL